MPALVHKDDDYETPDPLFDNIRYETKLRFELDVCASDKKSLCFYWFTKKVNALNRDWIINGYPFTKLVDVWCNPPRSKNGKFVRKAFEEWTKHNINIVMLLTWNDFGNKYGQECIVPYWMSGDIEVHNLGKIKFNKNGKPSKYVSRLNYCWVWFKSTNKT